MGDGGGKEGGGWGGRGSGGGGGGVDGGWFCLGWLSCRMLHVCFLTVREKLKKILVRKKSFQHPSVLDFLIGNKIR